MKNNKNYCKFVSQVKSSQVKSSQVKSSAKIVSLINNSFKIFLIALLFILLFSISCKSKQDPKLSKDDLVGTWKSINRYKDANIIFTIDSAGNLNFNCGVNTYDDTHCNYTGKLADTFEYPYTIELTFNISSHASITSCHYSKDNEFNSKISELSPKSQIGKFTFSDASTCAASFYTIWRGTTFGGWVAWTSWDKTDFTKQ